MKKRKSRSLYKLVLKRQNQPSMVSLLLRNQIRIVTARINQFLSLNGPEEDLVALRTALRAAVELVDDDQSLPAPLEEPLTLDHIRWILHNELYLLNRFSLSVDQSNEQMFTIAQRIIQLLNTFFETTILFDGPLLSSSEGYISNESDHSSGSAQSNESNPRAE